MPDPSREVALACQTPMAIAVAMRVAFAVSVGMQENTNCIVLYHRLLENGCVSFID